MCNTTVYSMIDQVENTRLIDVVDEMSRTDWFVKPVKPIPIPWKPTPIQPAAAAAVATTGTGNGNVNNASMLFATTDADTGTINVVKTAFHQILYYSLQSHAYNSHLSSTEAFTSSKGYVRSLVVSANHGFKSIASPFLHVNSQQATINGNHMRKMDKHVHLGNNHYTDNECNNHNNHNYSNNNNNKFSMGRSLHDTHETNIMDQLTIAATQAGHRLNAYLLKLSTAFHRDLRSTCDTFELLMRHYDDENSNCGGGEWGIGNHPMTTNAGSSHTNKSSSCPCPFPSSQSQRILENPQSLERLHEYLIVVRLLLIQTSASLLTTMDNIVIIKASADAYKKDNQKKKNLYPY